MEQQKIAAQLRELLDSIRDMQRAVRDASDSPQSAAHALIDFHERLAATCYGRLHYKTRIKLLRIVDQATGLVALCRLLEQPILPDQFDSQRLRDELFIMCRNMAHVLEPVVDYYTRERQHYDQDSSNAARRMGKVDFLPNERGVPQSGYSEHTHLQLLGNFENLTTSPDSVKKPSKTIPHMLKIGPTEVPVYFGTTRDPSGNPKDKPAARFLNGRGSGKLTFGRALVSIPPGHRIGKLEQPLTIWKLRLKPNPEKHVVLRSAEPMGAKDWVSAVREELNGQRQNMAFVFIHGLNVTFCQAMMRAGQIARDIGYDGLVTAFSWGSEGTVAGYPADEDTVLLAVPKLVEFLAKLRTDAGVEIFHIVAHSMGCRALLGALKETSWWNAPETPVSEAVFAAPDVDATLYRQSIAAMPRSANRYTLYGSERDWAIAVSRSIRKNHPRAGDGGNNILVMNGVETVDATEVGEHLFGLGHSYIADKRTILGDLCAVLSGLPMPRFGLREQTLQVGKYWALLP